MGSDAWEPNSPSGASFFVAQPFRDHPLYRKNVRLKRGARRGAGVRFETKFALPESLSLRDLYAALGRSVLLFAREPQGRRERGGAGPACVIDAKVNSAMNHLRIHEEIRRNAMGLKAGLRASRARGMPLGDFARRVQRARALVVADRCEEALRELQDLRRSLIGSRSGGEEQGSLARVRSPRGEAEAAIGRRSSDQAGPAARGRRVSSRMRGPGIRGAASVVTLLTVTVAILAFAQPVSASLTITVTDLGTLGGTASIAFGINNLRQVVGLSNTTTSGIRPHAFLWQNGVMTDLGTLGGQFDRGEAIGINDLGQVVGDSTTTSGAEHAFLWQNGAMTDLGTLGGGFSVAEGINRSGAVVGLSTTSSQTTHAFLWQNGAMTDLGTLGGAFSTASGINNLGQVVGSSFTSSGAIHAFLWQNGAMTDLGTLPGEVQSVALGINDLGQVVGGNNFAFFVGVGHAFLWQNGAMTDLGTLGGTFSTASGINNLGQVVGVSNTSTGLPYAFLWQNGVMTNLGTLSGDFASQALGINNQGQVVGTSATASGVLHAVLWTTAALATTVSIDIKPGGLPNAINLGSKGLTPVAILSTATFDATTANPATVKLAGAPVALKANGQPMASIQDVNGDGIPDLVLQVSTSNLQLTAASTTATLTGQTFGGQNFQGTDSVLIVPPS